MESSRFWSAIVGVATIIGTAIAVLAYCSPSVKTGSSVTTSSVPGRIPVPALKTEDLPVNFFWSNASGPPTFSLKSSAAVYETGTRLHGPRLAIRFSAENLSRVPVQLWAKSESLERSDEVEGWVVDAGQTLCKPRPADFSVISVANPSENLIKYDDYGAVTERAPAIGSRRKFNFTVRFECDEELTNSTFLFATVRLTFSHKKERRQVYFQSTGVKIFRSQ